jgi:hypothetical protein
MFLEERLSEDTSLIRPWCFASRGHILLLFEMYFRHILKYLKKFKEKILMYIDLLVGLFLNKTDLMLK